MADLIFAASGTSGISLWALSDANETADAFLAADSGDAASQERSQELRRASGSGPLSFPSCNPPQQVSPNLTIGTPDANGAAANAIGFAKVEVLVGRG